ncbi:ABC transporter ATP-binding protein [Syntrophotalea acetylenivorans]|uniref:ATP-binding protein Uup n=1 Tax=Syntrophotalea acetylenivorans TaxID=1842532 RepID=A0A1L3GR98_9BACT|nr:ATP-binding cassette domain-containing protein [Syntrophotalea acetylenivorans]APG28380.1 ABC transporter ATP-binding protein [Syntrophotalea acetylenivorans]
MVLLNLRDIHLAFGGPPLLDGVDLQVSRGERICLLGRNGAGKSTLLGLVARELQPDKGAVEFRQGVKVARLPQEVPPDLTGTVLETVLPGLGLVGEQIARCQHLTRLATESGNDAGLSEMLELQQQIEQAGGWQRLQGVEQVLTRLKLEAEAQVDSLSGGVKRRVLLARALVSEPDILLLDEPTNHLDIESINWLEEYLLRSNLTLLFVTHDRAFLRAVATRIVELERGQLFDFACDYDTFLVRRAEQLHAEEQAWAKFDRKLAEEEVWIRQGIKARRTRNEGRVRALQKMREERRQRRSRTGSVNLQMDEAGRSGKLVAEVEGLGFHYDERPLIENFSSTVLRGDRIGIIGPNGAGKTTLLKLLLGELEPQQGKVKLGTNLEVLYFDQLREQLDPELTVQQNLSGDQDTVTIGDQQRHVYGYLQDFLFTPDRARSPVRILSGGERNRLLLAKLFTRPANLLVLDEPTNDLDLETLDLLEELLADYKGTLFLVSHDREFINRVATSCFVFEGEGKVGEYVGGYDDWLRQRPTPKVEPAKDKVKTPRSKPVRERPRKLSFKERKELDELPQLIDDLEEEIEALQQQLADPELYRSRGEAVAGLQQRLAEAEQELEEAFGRWEELDALAPS